MTTAFVLSGGGSLGAVQVGMLQALGERGVAPDLLVGTSAGAINAAFVGGHGMSAEALLELAGLWRSLRRRDVFTLRPLQGVLATAGIRPSLFSAEPLRRLVAANLGYTDLMDSRVEVHLVSTDLLTGQEVLLSSGDAASAVVASAAIPGVFPPVCRESRVLVDGGIAEHAAIRHAIERGADEGTSCRPGSRAPSPQHRAPPSEWPCRR
jgi:NTE family protein